MAYLVRVFCDGDTEIKQIETRPDPADCSYVVLDTVEDVARELKEYGHEEDRINEALTEASNSVDWVDV